MDTLTNNTLEEIPAFCAAFDIAFGQKYGQDGVTLDINMPVLYNALRKGGMTDSMINDTPVIISETTDINHGGLATGAHSGNFGRPAISLFTNQKDGMVRSTTAAHEARHVADVLTGIGYTNQHTKRIRKAIVTAGGVLIGTTMYKLGHEVPSLEPFALPYSLLLADVYISSSLAIEYLTRPEERRARKAADSVTLSNIIQVSSPHQIDDSETRATHHTPVSFYAKLCIAGLRSLLIPNYRM